MPAPGSKFVAQLAREIAKIHEAGEDNILRQIRSLLLPLVANAKQEKSRQKCNQLIDTIIKHIEDISCGFVTHLQTNNDLSMREIRIALMVKDNLTNQEIADYLCITPETVKTHRRNIRRKLGITGTNSELNTYLRSLRYS
jgi:DNA-binding CsgD family transcriptional regulator